MPGVSEQPVAKGAVDVDGAVVDCGDGEDNVCADTVVGVVGDFATLTEAVAAAAIHCQDMDTLAGKKQCVADIEQAAQTVKPVVADIEQAVADCA